MTGLCLVKKVTLNMGILSGKSMIVEMYIMRTKNPEIKPHIQELKIIEFFDNANLHFTPGDDGWIVQFKNKKEAFQTLEKLKNVDETIMRYDEINITLNNSKPFN